MSNPVLTLSNIQKSFTQGDNRLDVLKGASLSIMAGERLALTGPSGSGKSTFLHIAGLLESPDSGQIIIGDQDASGKNDAERTLLRRHKIGFVYQFHHLLPEFSARENIMLPQIVSGASLSDAATRADELLDLIGLSERSTHRPARLSGGEQQRVAIARALANKPKLLIADEPTGNLDPETAEHVFEMLEHLTKTQGLGLLMATHNHDLAARMDRHASIKDGLIQE